MGADLHATAAGASAVSGLGRKALNDSLHLFIETCRLRLGQPMDSDARRQLEELMTLVEVTWELSSRSLAVAGGTGDGLLQRSCCIWRQIGAQRDVLVTTEFDPRQQISDQEGLALTLIVYEAFMNCLDHAFPDGGGGAVTISLRHDAASGGGCLDVVDDGAGSDLVAVVSRLRVPAISSGLQRAALHARALGGALDFAACTPRGTRLRVAYPR